MASVCREMRSWKRAGGRLICKLWIEKKAENFIPIVETVRNEYCWKKGKRGEFGSGSGNLKRNRERLRSDEAYPFGRNDMWHVIQVTTGKEEEMRLLIEREADPDLYERCFYIKRERIWRRDGQCIVHVETMFPGYLFVITDGPKDLYWKLKEIPQFTKMLRAEDEIFLSVAKDEQEFLENLLNGDKEDIVRLSKVKLNEKKEIISAEGPLKHYIGNIVKKKTRLRYVMIDVVLFGKKRTVLIGIDVI